MKLKASVWWLIITLLQQSSSVIQVTETKWCAQEQALNIEDNLNPIKPNGISTLINSTSLYSVLGVWGVLIFFIIIQIQ